MRMAQSLKNKRAIHSLSTITEEIKAIAMNSGAGNVGVSPMIKEALYKEGMN